MSCHCCNRETGEVEILCACCAAGPLCEQCISPCEGCDEAIVCKVCVNQMYMLGGPMVCPSCSPGMVSGHGATIVWEDWPIVEELASGEAR